MEPNKERTKIHNQSESSRLAGSKTSISQEALDQLFREARTHSTWLPEPVPVELLRKAYAMARLGPTSANTSPARFVFLTSPGAKALLKPVLLPGNVDKTMAAPVTVIIAWDTEFHEKLPMLFPQFDMRSYLSATTPLLTRPPSATVRCRLLISSWLRVLWG
jgi:3-hydroxypropanoate dehydrogenase